MNLCNFFTSEETRETTHFWLLARYNSEASLDNLAHHLADRIMAHRCRGAMHFYHAWRARVLGGPAPAGGIRTGLETYIKSVFGLPGQPITSNHLEGYVGELLWYFMYQELPPDGDILRIEPPGYKSTDAGGDSLVIYRLSEGHLMFRLWELKKNSAADGQVSTTINTAYNQLNAHSLEYLARYTAIGQELDDTELADFYGQLIELWDAASHMAAAGVCVATSSGNVPAQCFTTFGDQFPKFISPVRLKGMLTAVDDFTSFAEKVRDRIWTGL